ncbi:hypothetical protein MJD09_06175 [bacterium]|nr:hypothetical protein [bacterium]
MKCDIKNELLIGYVYEDLHPEEKQALEDHLPHCSKCQSTLAEFASTIDFLRIWPDEEPNLQLTFVEDQASILETLRLRWLTAIKWRKVGVGFLATTAAALLFLSLLNFQASYSQGNFAVRLSLWPGSALEESEPVDPMSLPVTKAEFTAWRQQSMQMIHQMIETTEERQHRQMDVKLATYARELDAVRRDDLKVLGEGLQVFQMTNENRFQQTNQVIQELVRFARHQGSQPQIEDQSQGR